MNSEFLTFDQIQIGSWWEIADGAKYGYCIIGKNEQTQDVEVLSTCGEKKVIDYFKLQYRYRRVDPDAL